MPNAPSPAALVPAMPHPALFLVLIVPFGMAAGFVIVTLAYQLTQRGLSSTAVAGMIALIYVPQTWKVLWAPLVDTTWTRRRWYACGTLLCGLCTFLLSGAAADARAIDLTLLGSLIVAGSFFSTLIAMAVESFMAASVPDSHRGRVAGWYQAGNLGGLGLGGGLALWLIQSAHWSAAAAGGALCAVAAACCTALAWIPEPGAEGPRHADLAAHARAVGRDLWGLVRSRTGALAVLICFLPLASGAASNLWSVVAGEWHATAGTVALVNGALAGVISAAGCLVGGWFADRMDRKRAYCVYGLLQAACALGMAYSGRTSPQFVLWTSLYAFAAGLTYAGFSALVLEAIGRTAAATKYNLMASLVNMPAAWMTLVDGSANDRWHGRGMLLTEAAVATTAVLLFVAVARTTRRREAGLAPEGAPVAG